MFTHKIEILAICDGCGVILAKELTAKPSEINPIRWKWQRSWKKERVLMRERKFRKPLIYCPDCADAKPKKALNRLYR